MSRFLSFNRFYNNAKPTQWFTVYNCALYHVDNGCFLFVNSNFFETETHDIYRAFIVPVFC